MMHISQTREAKAKFLSNPILEHGATLLRQRHAVKDYFPTNLQINEPKKLSKIKGAKVL